MSLGSKFNSVKSSITSAFSRFTTSADASLKSGAATMAKRAQVRPGAVGGKTSIFKTFLEVIRHGTGFVWALFRLTAKIILKGLDVIRMTLNAIL